MVVSMTTTTISICWAEMAVCTYISRPSLVANLLEDSC